MNKYIISNKCIPYGIQSNSGNSWFPIGNKGDVFISDGNQSAITSPLINIENQIVKIYDDAIIVNSSNNVGINKTPDPLYNLDIDGILRVTPSNNINLPNVNYGVSINSPV